MATQGPPELRPLDLGEKLDVGLRLWTRNFKPLTLGALIVVVPVAILSTLLQASVDPNAFSTSPFDFDATEQSVDEGAQLAGLMINLTLTTVGSGLALAALTKAIADAYTGHTPSWRDSVMFALKRLHSILWLGLLFVLGVTVAAVAGLLALIVGIFVFPTWVGVAWSTALVVLLVEDVRGTKALRRSWRLVKNRWWATFGTLLVAYLLIYVVQLPIGVLTLVFFAIDSEVVVAAATTFLTIVGYSIMLPLGAAITALVYFDLRIRKEGFDLELLAKRIGHEEGAIAGAVPMPPPKTLWMPPGAQPQPPQRPPPSYGGFAPPQAAPGWGPAPPRGSASSGFAPAPPPPEGSEPPPQ